jgi:tetratricopeptide (TPR) repeat protein
MNYKGLAAALFFILALCTARAEDMGEKSNLRSPAEPAQARGGRPAREAAEIYNKANQFYAANNFQAALDTYLVLIERGVKNHYLYYNLGNTYFKLGETGYAILYYEKALDLRPFDRETRENLDFARNSLKEKVLPLYSESFFNLLRVTYSYLNLRNIAVLELVFFSILIVFCYLYLFIPYKRQAFKKYFILSAVLFIIFSSAAFLYQSNEKKHPKGIVVEKEVEVLTAPIAESDVMFILYEGTTTKLLEARDKWLLISLSDGREGWVYTQGIVFI